MVDNQQDVDRYDLKTMGEPMTEEIPDGPNVTYVYRPMVNFVGRQQVKNFNDVLQVQGPNMFSSLRELHLFTDDRPFFHTLDPKLCPNLERLYIMERYSRYIPYEEQNPLDKLSLVTKYGKNLRSFKYDQPYLSHECVVDFIDYSSMADTLEDLWLRLIDFRHFEQYNFVFRRLRQLRINNVRQESWRGFGQMLKKCPKLQHLDFSRMAMPSALLKPILYYMNLE